MHNSCSCIIHAHASPLQHTKHTQVYIRCHACIYSIAIFFTYKQHSNLSASSPSPGSSTPAPSRVLWCTAPPLLPRTLCPHWVHQTCSGSTCRAHAHSYQALIPQCSHTHTHTHTQCNPFNSSSHP